MSAKGGLAVGDFLEADVERQVKKTSRATIGKLADLLERQNIDVEDIGKINRINAWNGFYKNADDEAEIVDMVAIQFTPEWAEGPKWPVIQPSPPVKMPPLRCGAKSASALKTAVVLPDIQIGYWRDTAEALHPCHDEAALDVALQATKAAKPDLVVLVGDNLDLPEWSKYRKHSAFQRTTQATIDRAGLFAAQVRAVAPDAEIVWLAGNHEERLPNYIIDNASAAFGIKRCNAPESWPVLSVPDLCRLDDVGITFVPGYPANDFWINERLRVIHGDKVVSNGSTAHRYLSNERVSTIYGHIHRREWGERTREAFSGPRTILAMSPGCLCRVDGKVPSTKSGNDLDGMPMGRIEDWQQGLVIVEFEEGDGAFFPEMVPIHDGRARWRGKDFSATVDVEGCVT